MAASCSVLSNIPWIVLFFRSRPLRLNVFLLLCLQSFGVQQKDQSSAVLCFCFEFFLSFPFPKRFHLLQSCDTHTVHCRCHSGLSKNCNFCGCGALATGGLNLVTFGSRQGLLGGMGNSGSFWTQEAKCPGEIQEDSAGSLDAWGCGRSG